MANQLRILLASLFLLGAIAISAFYADKLPSKVPIHFDGRGAANGWGPQKMALVSTPAMEAFLCLIYAAASAAVHNKKYLKRRLRKPLSDENLQVIMKRSVAVIDWVIIWTMALFLDLQIEGFLVAMSRREKLSLLLFPFLGLIFLGLVYHTARLLMAPRRAVNQGGTASPS